MLMCVSNEQKSNMVYISNQKVGFKYIKFNISFTLLKVTRRSRRELCCISFIEVRGETGTKLSCRARLSDNLVI